jgi:hypothetical protein
MSIIANQLEYCINATAKEGRLTQMAQTMSEQQAKL